MGRGTNRVKIFGILAGAFVIGVGVYALKKRFVKEGVVVNIDSTSGWDDVYTPSPDEVRIYVNGQRKNEEDMVS